MTFIFPTDTKDDFTAENGVTYSWVEPSHWRVKSFKSPDGQTVIVDDDPPEHKEGQLWFCTKDEYLTLYISLSGQWVPASPPVSLDGITQYTEDLQKQITELAKNQTPYEIFLPVMEGVDYNTRELTNLRSRVVDVELLAGDALPKAGGTMTGNLSFRGSNENPWWDIKALKPTDDAHTDSHGVRVDIGHSNTYKQFLKVIGRGAKELISINDDQGGGGGSPNEGKGLNGKIVVKGRITLPKEWEFGDNDAVSKRYVDNAVTSGGDINGDVVLKGRLDIKKPQSSDKADNSFMIHAPMWDAQEEKTKQGVLLKDYRPKSGEKYSSSIWYYGLIDKPNSIITRQYLEDYVAANAPKPAEGAIAKSGTDTNPTLKTGELYLCTTDNTLRVGV